MRFEIGETSTYKNSLMSLLSLVIFGQFKKAAGRQVLFTVRFVIISSLTTSQNALDFAVSVRILLSIQRMRYFIVLDLCQTCSFGLIDSFPYTLCHPIRNMRATLLSDVADIGYHATKKIHYYGLKFSVLVSDSGFPIDYAVTPASIYDGDVALELLESSPFPIVYGDKGYVDRQTKAALADYGIQLISQLRKNMMAYSWLENYQISRLRKPAETVFSSLEQFGMEALRCRNIQVLKFKTEAILFIYSLLLKSSHTEFGISLKYSLAYA